MARNFPSRGIAHLGLILGILVVIAAIAFGGWYVWDKNKDDGKSNTPKNSSQTNKTQNEEPGDPSEGGKYLVIKEWGVRFELPEELKGDVKYGIFTFTNGDQTAYFASKKIVAHAPGGACDLAPLVDSSGQGVFGGTIAVTRSTVQPEEIDQRTFQSTNYWYTLGFGNGGACYEGDGGQEKGKFNSLIDEAIRDLESVEL